MFSMLPTCAESFFVAVVPAVILAVAGPSLGDAVAIGAAKLVSCTHFPWKMKTHVIVNIKFGVL